MASQSGMRNLRNNKLAIKTKCENAMAIIYVEIVHIPMSFDNFEFKRLVNNELRVFFIGFVNRAWELFQINSQSKQIVKIQCPLLTWKLFISSRSSPSSLTTTWKHQDIMAEYIKWFIFCARFNYRKPSHTASWCNSERELREMWNCEGVIIKMRWVKSWFPLFLVFFMMKIRCGKCQNFNR